MMKKITLLFALLITSIGFSQAIDLLTNGDFSNGKENWVGGDTFSVVEEEAFISETNAGGNLWDTQLVYGGLEFENAKEYVFTFYARAAAERKITVAIQNVGMWDDQFRQEFDLTTRMTEYTATFTATSDNANVQIGFLMAGTPSTEAIYYDDISLLTTVAEPTCEDGIKNGKETDVDCGGPDCDACDETAPTDFTATVGTIGAFGVELLLNATDDSEGLITYEIYFYDDDESELRTSDVQKSFTNPVQTTGPSGAEKSFTFSGLTPETSYYFEVIATDASGNNSGSVYLENVRTIADPSTPCA
jgi:hypothetical protein